MTLPASSSPADYLLREAGAVLHLLATDRPAGVVRLRRGVGVLRAALLFRRCRTGELVNSTGFVRVVADGRITIGDRAQFAGGMLPTELICHEGGELVVGAHAFFNYGVSVEASRSIHLGDRCLFGSMVRIRDAGESGTSPVSIGDDVWIAHGALIEPGSTVGAGSVVAAGSVVRGTVPPRSLAVGNPAVCVPLSRAGARAVGAGRVAEEELEAAVERARAENRIIREGAR